MSRPVGLVVALVALVVGFVVGRSSQRGSDAPAPVMAPMRHGSPIASWDGGTVGEDELNAFLASKPPLLRNELSTPDGRKRLVTELVDQELLAAEARSRGLDHAVGTRLQIDAVLAEAVVAQQRPEAVTDEALQREYESRVAEFVQQEQRKVRIVVVPLEKQAGARTLAERIRKEPLTDPGALARTARTTSIDPSSVNDGDLGFVTEVEVSSRFGELAARAVKSLSAGALSEPLPVPAGLMIARVESITPSATVPFDAVKEQLRREVSTRVEAGARMKLLEALRANAHLTYDEAALGRVSPTRQ